ncbi:MAG TPA: riboflavin synthase [Rhodanobacteraceae bacterium]|nr:riboflavin synthase [Rhodanobacteraceae bacterium]
MFTGIVQSVGRIARLEPRGGDVRLHVDTVDLDLADVALGDSIAVSGCCLTVVSLAERGFAADVSNESLSLTTLGKLKSGDPVNLEKALRLADRLGGHLVSGHVDGLGKVVSVTTDGRSQRWTFEVPEALARYIAHKGSVTIDGTSLTVNEVDGTRFGVNLIPHTVEHTSFHARKAGDAVNIEVDVVARYIERLLGNGTVPAGIDTDFLKRHGFA